MPVPKEIKPTKIFSKSSIIFYQLTLTCSKSKMETPEQYVICVQS